VKAAGVSHPAEIARRWTCHLIGIADLSYFPSCQWLTVALSYLTCCFPHVRKAVVPSPAIDAAKRPQ
jgi:hypothetical protein